MLVLTVLGHDRHSCYKSFICWYLIGFYIKRSFSLSMNLNYQSKKIYQQHYIGWLSVKLECKCCKQVVECEYMVPCFTLKKTKQTNIFVLSVLNDEFTRLVWICIKLCEEWNFLWKCDMCLEGWFRQICVSVQCMCVFGKRKNIMYTFWCV